MSQFIVSHSLAENYIPDHMYIQLMDHIRCYPYTIQFIDDFYPQPAAVERRIAIRNMFVVISKYLRHYRHSVKVLCGDNQFKTLTRVYTNNTNFGELFDINEGWESVHVASTMIRPYSSDCILFVFHTFSLSDHVKTFDTTMNQYLEKQRQQYKEVHVISYSAKESSGITMPLNGYTYIDCEVCV